MFETKDINPIGIGTFRIDLTNPTDSLKALNYSFNNGQNYIDTSHLYENGNNLIFLSDFFKQINRENIFITTNLERYIEQVADIERQLDNYLKLMKLDYVDGLQLHTPLATKIPLLDTFAAMNELVKKGKVRFLSSSNMTLEDLQLVQSNFKLFGFSGPFNFECRIYEKIGVLDYCAKENIKFIAYQPLRRNRTASREYPLLVELSQKYGKTQNQIILNWIIKEKKLSTLLKTTNISNIKDNLESLNFSMNVEDIQKMNDFESKEFSAIEIDWKGNGGVTIDQLPNQFD